MKRFGIVVAIMMIFASVASVAQSPRSAAPPLQLRASLWM